MHSGIQFSLIHDSALSMNKAKFDNSNFRIKIWNKKYVNLSHEYYYENDRLLKSGVIDISLKLING